MKRQLYTCCILLLLICLCATKGQAQPKPIVLTGTMLVETGEKFPYKIEFTESEGVIKGYAYTFSEPQQTKATIKGTLDRTARTLRFKEVEIISSHVVLTKAFMCLVHARLEYAHTNLGGELKGPITSSDIDNAKCTPGSVVFNNDEELQKLFALPEKDKYDTVISMKKRIAVKEPPLPRAPIPTPLKEEPTTAEKVTAGDEKSYEWHTDTVGLEIWDGGDNIDGDRVTIKFNGKVVLAQHSLTKERKVLRLPLEGTGINSLVIIADNEGSDPPNTATLLLADGPKRYKVVAYNTRGQQAMIKIKKTN